MKQLFIGVLVIFSLILSGCKLISSDTTEPEFGFVFQYGIESQIQNILDTFKGTYTRGKLTRILIFSKTEMATILEKMNKIDFFSYPEDFQSEISAGSLIWGSYTTYYFKVKYRSTFKEIKWQDMVIEGGARADALRTLVFYIQDIIETKTSQRRKSDFDFVFTYGIGANTLNTFHHKFTKDTTPPVTINFSLSKTDMDSIYQKMLEIGFFNYPNYFATQVTQDSICSKTPYSSYYFQVKYGTDFKELWWADCIFNPNVQADKLRELIKLITGIIDSKAQYKKLPHGNI